jgi:hypothetical protein
MNIGVKYPRAQYTTLVLDSSRHLGSVSAKKMSAREGPDLTTDENIDDLLREFDRQEAHDRELRRQLAIASQLQTRYAATLPTTANVWLRAGHRRPTATAPFRPTGSAPGE